MENGKDFSSMIAAAMNNSEQLMMIDKMLNRANFALNRKENLECNIARVVEKERWRNLGEVEGFEQYTNYEVSTFGQVKSLDYNHTGKERILKLSKRPDGYLKITLTANGKRKYFMVHRLVASAFVKNNDPENKTVCNHKNHGSKTDNHYLNLEWCTQKENIQAFFDYDLEKVEKRYNTKSGENHPMFGKKHSDESRRKMSIAAKAAHARKREQQSAS